MVLLTVTFILLSSCNLAFAQSPLTLGLVRNDHLGDGIDTDKEIKQTHVRLFDYIASKLGNFALKVVIVDNTTAIVDLLKNQKVDLYLGSPLISALVDNKSQATPLLTMWLADDSHYHSMIVTRKDSPVIYHLYDLKGGKTFGFSDPESNIGYLLPKSYLMENGIKFSPPSSPADMFYIFTGGENKTLAKILNRTIDAGAISSQLFDSLPSSLSSKLKVVGKSIDIPISIISHRSDMDPGLVDRIISIINNMKTDPQADTIFKKLSKEIELKTIDAKLSENLTGMVAKAINGTESSYL